MGIENSCFMTFFYDHWLGLCGTFGRSVMMSLTMLIGLLAGRRLWVRCARSI